MSENAVEISSYLFVSSAQMWPSQINATYPGAQFVARARASVSDVAITEHFAGVVTDHVWGVLIAAPALSDSARSISVSTDDGRELLAAVLADSLLGGPPQDVLAAARYWELPPAFVRQLREALQAGGIAVEDEEPRDDGNLG